MNNKNQRLNDAIKALKDHLGTIPTDRYSYYDTNDALYDLIASVSEGLTSIGNGSFERAKHEFKSAHDIARMLEANNYA